MRCKNAASKFCDSPARFHSETLGLEEAIDLIVADSNVNIASLPFDCVPDSTTNETAKTNLVSISGIVGAAGSRVSVPVAMMGRLFQMPQVSYASTSSLLSDRKRYSYFRRTIPPDNLQVLAMVEILLRFGWNYVSILYSEDTYGSSGVNEFVNVSAGKGICIDLRQGLPLSFSDSDYDRVVEQLGNSNARVVILFANQDSVRHILRRVHQNKALQRRFTWIASDGWANAFDLVQEFNETAAGLFGVLPLTDHLASFDDYISQLTINSNTRNPWFSEWYAALANCTQEECDNNTNITNFSYQQDVFVPLVVDAVYAFAHALHDFLVDNCNSTDTAPFLWFKENRTCLGQSRELNGSSLLEYLSKVNFTSNITDKSVLFDKSGSVQGFYKIQNYQARFSENSEKPIFKFVDVGTWLDTNANGSLDINDTNLQFGLYSNGTLRTEQIQSHCGKCGSGTIEIPRSCCNICEPCLGRNFSSAPHKNECSSCLVEGEREMWGNSPFTGSDSCVLIPETSAMYSDPWAIPSLILGCIGLLCVAATAVVFAIYWKTPIVKSSGREQMILILIGIFCSFVLPFFYLAPPSIPICLVNRLGIWFCYSLMFGALAIKVQRVARIFYGVKRNLHYTPRFATPIYQVIFTLTIAFIQMILIIISLALVHPKPLRILRYDQESEGLLGLPEVVVICQKEETAVVVVSLLYETCIIVFATIVGVFSFKFPKNFNEAKYISFCTFSLLVVWLGLIPAYFTTESQPEIQNAVISLFTTLSAFGVLCFIFGPKLFIVLFHPEKNTFETHQSDTKGTGTQTTVKS